MLEQAEREIEFDYVVTAAATIADWLSEEPAASRAEIMSRFQIVEDVIWSPEIYHRISAALDRLHPLPHALRFDA
jgi:hypothetical protein